MSSLVSMITSTDIMILGNLSTTNESAAFSEEESLMLPYVEIPFLLIVIIFGTIGNIFIIGATLIEDQLLKAGGAFIINLAVADLIITAWHLPVILANVFNGYSNVFAQVPWLCYITGFLASWCCQVSMLSMMFIAFNRYWKVTRMELKSKYFKKKFMIFFIFFIWIECFLLALPLIVGWFGRPTATIPALIRFDQQMVACMWHDQIVIEYNIFLVCVAILLPLMATAYFYISIYLHIRKRKQAPWKKTSTCNAKLPDTTRQDESVTVTEVSTGANNSTTGANNSTTGANNSSTKSILNKKWMQSVKGRSRKSIARQADKREQNLMLTLVVVVVFFALFWTPYAIMTLFANDSPTLAKRVCGWLALSNSAINSVIYGVLNRHFRRGYLKLLKKMLSIFQCCCGESMVKFIESIVVKNERIPSSIKSQKL